MAKTSANSLFNSLRGKIWLATTALAFFICIFGLVSHLLVSYLISNPLYAVFLPFIFSAISVIVFGWWLSDQVTAPVEKVSLLAKSLERGVSATMPKTSGSTETDDLLESLQGISSQVQKLVSSMEDVVNGNLDAALSENVGADRVSQTFQKLLAKFTESIHAKADLDKLRQAVEHLTDEVSPIRLGNLDTEIKSDSLAVKELAAAYKFLLENLREFSAQINLSATDSNDSANEVKNLLQSVIKQDEVCITELTEASKTLKKLPSVVQKISDEISQSAQSAEKSIEKVRSGNNFAEQNLSTVGTLRKLIQESKNRIERLNERALELGKITKTIEDLAQRTSLVSLNASIQAAELGDAGKGFLLISEEIGRLAQRAENTNKQVAALNKSLRNEIEDVSASLENSASETANLTKFAMETGNALGDLEHYIASFLNLQNKIVSYSSEQSKETEEAFEVFVNEISVNEKNVSLLKSGEEKIADISETIKSLQKLTTQFKTRKSDTLPQMSADKEFAALINEVSINAGELTEK